MRILLVTLFYPPHRSAGTENYTHSVAQALTRRGHAVEVVCAGTWEEGDDYWNGVVVERVSDVPVRRINLNWTKASNPNRVLYDCPIVERCFEAILAEFTPDLVHVTSASTLGVGVLRAPHRRGIPLILTLMDFWFACPRTVLTTTNGRLCDGRTTAWECQKCLLTSSNVFRRLNPYVPGPLEPSVWGAAAATPGLARARGLRGMALDMDDRKRTMREALQWPDVILSHSRFVRDIHAAAGLSDRVQHLPNGHDLTWLGQYRGKSRSAVIRFGYVGQLTEMKGVHRLVEAFRSARLAGKARLDIWGDPRWNVAYTDRLQTLIGEDPGIWLRGPFSRATIAQVFEEMDVLVVPSVWYENAPLVIQEAFATGTPVIATRLGGMAEAVTHGVNGLLFERDDTDDLRRQLTSMIEQPRLLAELVRGVPPVCTIDEEMDKLELAYENAISRRKGGGQQSLWQ